MIHIQKLNYAQMKGQTYSAEIRSESYLSIEPADESSSDNGFAADGIAIDGLARDGRTGDGFVIEWKKSEQEIVMPLTDAILSDWLEDPVAYGAYDGTTLVGFVEGFLESWNNRFRIANICVFDLDKRNAGIGQQLLETITADAIASGARMIVLETQSFNSKAISFYKKNGFQIIGFDRFAYSNTGPEDRNMRIEMGKKL